jgi:hypothetical protein
MVERANDLSTLAVLTTSKAGQFALSREKDPEVVKALGHAWRLHPEVANELARGRNRTAAARALRAVDDLDLLDRKLNGGKLEWAVRNTQAPVQLLEQGLAAYSPEAACNPNTPEDLRRRHLTAKTVQVFAHKAGSTTYAVARNHELALANPWALEAADATWPAHFRRGLTALPQASLEDLTRLDARTIRHAKAKTHPAVYRLDPEQTSVERLLEINHPAADLLALGSDRFEHHHLSSLVRSQHLGIDEEGEDPTLPHILGRAYNLFGPALVRAIDTAPNRMKAYYRWPISGTRVKGAAWIAPGLEYLAVMSPWVFNEIEQVEPILNECLETWQVFLGLVRKRDGEGGVPMVRVATAARKLVHGA